MEESDVEHASDDRGSTAHLPMNLRVTTKQRNQRRDPPRTRDGCLVVWVLMRHSPYGRGDVFLRASVFQSQI